MANETPVVFQNQGQQIVGMWHAPVESGADGFPVVVFCHGFTGNKSESQRIFVETARTLALSGIASLRIDFRGSGDSEGDFVDITVSGEVSDAVTAVEFAKAQPGVDPRRIGMLGLSLGGLVTVLSLPHLPDLAAAVLWNPVSDAVGVARRRSSPENDARLMSTGVADYNGWAVGRAFLEELPTLRPLETISQHGLPVLVVLGDADGAVPNTDGLAYVEARQRANLPVDVHMIAGAGHTFESLEARPEAIQHTVNWIVRTLGRGGG